MTSQFKLSEFAQDLLDIILFQMLVCRTRNELLLILSIALTHMTLSDRRLLNGPIHNGAGNEGGTRLVPLLNAVSPLINQDGRRSAGAAVGIVFDFNRDRCSLNNKMGDGHKDNVERDLLI